MIRAATLEDIPALVELGRQLHAESPRWSRLAYSAEKVAALVHYLITSSDGFAWVAVRRGAIVGYLIALIDAHWCSDDRVAQELSFFVRSDARGALYAARLIAVLDAWAEMKGAKWCQVGISTGIDVKRAVRLYQRLGFQRCAIGLERTY